MPIDLDATYSLGRDLSGVGVYSREILFGLAVANLQQRFRWRYRPHRFAEARLEPLPPNCSRALLVSPLIGLRPPALFHGLNQRMPRARAKVNVCTFHDLFVITGEYSTRDFRERFAKQAVEAAARSDLIVAVSAFTAWQVQELLGFPGDRIRVVHHGVRPLPPATPTAREPMVLHVGAIQKRKNIGRLVRAFENLPPPWRLVLAGSKGYGADDELAAVRSGRVEVTGYVDPDQLADLYARASIFCFPSLDEGFGMPVLEAMSRGVPVIASGRAALPEVCGDAAVLVDPLREDEIAHALLRFANDSSLRADYAGRGVDRASGFTWERATDRTWAAYRELGI